MECVLAFYGTRGDVEPGVAVGVELLRRGHQVRMAVAPDLVGFAEEAGLAAVPFGPDSRSVEDAQATFLNGPDFFRNIREIPNLMETRREAREFLAQTSTQMSRTLTPLADGAELLITHLFFEESALDIAEYHAIPMATLHYFPVRPNGRVLPFLPAPIGRSALRFFWWLSWRTTRKAVDARRLELGLPKTNGPALRRIADRGSLEIQAYEEACFPGLAAEWAKFDRHPPLKRPFVGALTLGLATDTDADVASWIAAGSPPIYFGFGSTAVDSPGDTIEMIGAACAELGERALVCAGAADFSQTPRFDHVAITGALNYAAVFPACRAVVHHGGSGTTAASMRAGIPTLILWTWPDQSLFGTQVERLQVGSARRFSTTTRASLVADLRKILAPEYAARARRLSTQMTTPAESVVNVADLLEKFARSKKLR